ncbi:MAG: CRISPR system precrRNA processing endoribonuclease RAMP protein Cas6 [Caldilineae bacterium]|nr:MAG: CRISPR system precrRNA processing endoribonuclease RAMP protein Cas6 [Caldilineae bacterium]
MRKQGCRSPYLNHDAPTPRSDRRIAPMTPDTLFHDLTVHHIRFQVEAITPIEMDAFKGSALRGAWQSYIRRAYCPAPTDAKTSATHRATCPVCYLTARDTGPEGRRPFALRPPFSRQRRYEPGEQFSFTFSLFGDTIFLLPYVILAVAEVGETCGLGRRLDESGRRGRYRLQAVQTVDPHRGQEQELLDATNRVIHPPQLCVGADSIAGRAQALAGETPGGAMRLDLLSPLRLIRQQGLMREFHFPVFVQRLLERLFALGAEFGREGERYDKATLAAVVARYLPLAAQVQVVEDATAWWDVQGYSSRTGRRHYLGGLVGHVVLQAQDWRPFLPLLLWGESVQLGKNVVKGGGCFRVSRAGPVPSHSAEAREARPSQEGDNAHR